MILEQPKKMRRKESLSLSFSDTELTGIVSSHDEALAVALTVANHNLPSILINMRS